MHNSLKEYQVRDKRSRRRHLILVFCAYTFILWHTLTGGLRRRWENKPLNTFTDALEAFRTAIYFRFVCCGPSKVGRYSLLIKQVRCSVWA